MGSDQSSFPWQRRSLLTSPAPASGQKRSLELQNTAHNGGGRSQKIETVTRSGFVRLPATIGRSTEAHPGRMRPFGLMILR